MVILHTLFIFLSSFNYLNCIFLSVLLISLIAMVVRL